jgi:hydroxymethylbilane synthase
LRTRGDLLSDQPLAEAGDKGFFTAEIDRALVDGEIDLAVHSLKDLPTRMAPGLALAAVLAREDPRDVLVVAGGERHDLDSLPRGARVGSSSLRRQAFVARWRRDLVPVDLRGNVPTRIARLDAGRYDAIVLAAAGLRRLGLESRASAALPVDRFPPAPGQGALAVVVRDEAGAPRRVVATLDDSTARATTAAERALLRRLEGGCQIPLGALAEVSGGELELFAMVCSRDGRAAVEGRRQGAVGDAESIGEALAEELLARGGREILDALRPAAPGG